MPMVIPISKNISIPSSLILGRASILGRQSLYGFVVKIRHLEFLEKIRPASGAEVEEMEDSNK